MRLSKKGSGNADIRGPGLRIVVQGKPNSFASPGRPSTAFSPKASRLSRAMLMEPEKWWLQTELADATELSAGYVSKVMGRLVDDGLVARGDGGRVQPKDPPLLLEAWSQVYDFSRHEISRYHAVGHTGAAVLGRLAASLGKIDDLAWAATGLAAAWQLDRFADFRMVTIYVSKPLLDPEHLSLRSVERGENVWVVVPRDEGVLHGSQEIEGVRCVHPVQVYLDLLGHPERAKEAAIHLRASHLGWRS
jgi:Transcriptional regulator, AbiEi antitoxin, Type IV TA system